MKKHNEKIVKPFLARYESIPFATEQTDRFVYSYYYKGFIDYRLTINNLKKKY
jgi:hypothetical protein